MAPFKAIAICAIFATLFLGTNGANVVRADGGHEAVSNDTTGGAEQVSIGERYSDSSALHNSGRESTGKVKTEELKTDGEVSLREEQPVEMSSEKGASKAVHASTRTSLPVSARVTCGHFFRCNSYQYYNRCFTLPSTVWYARYFGSSGYCTGNVYISGRQICIRAGSYCCARIYYMRA